MNSMIAVRSLAEYKTMISAETARPGRIFKNAAQMPSAMKKAILEGRLYVQQFPHGCFFFLDEGRFYSVYYYWDAQRDFPELAADKPLVIQELDQEGICNPSLAEKEACLLRSGFALHRKNLLMERSADLPCDPPALPARYRIVYSTEGEFPRALDMWERFLDLTDIPWDHCSLLAEDKLAFVKDERDEVCAVYWWKIHGKHSEGRHVVTEPAHARKGFARALLSEWIRDASSRGCRRLTTWISDVNSASLELYKSMGFSETGKICYQYIKDMSVQQSITTVGGTLP